MPIDVSHEALVGLYGKKPAELVLGLYSVAAGNNYLFLTESTDISNFTGSSNLPQLQSVSGNGYLDMVTASAQTAAVSFTNTASAVQSTVTINHIKVNRSPIIILAGGLFIASVTIAAENNTAGDTTYFTPYITVNFVNNGVTTNIIPKTKVASASTTANSQTIYGMLNAQVIPNTIVIPPNSRIQIVIELDGYVSAGTGLLWLGSSANGADFSGSSYSGTWISLPILAD